MDAVAALGNHHMPSYLCGTGYSVDTSTGYKMEVQKGDLVGTRCLGLVGHVPAIETPPRTPPSPPRTPPSAPIRRRVFLCGCVPWYGTRTVYAGTVT